MSGTFISIDGVDGGGKSTQLELLKNWFESQGSEPLMIRDPGGTKVGESLREILLHRKEIPLCMTAEMLMYMASRSQLVSEVVRPALEAERVVLSDRYLLANVVYQGSAGGLPVDSIWNVGEIATGGLLPDLTIVLDIAPEIAMKRIARGLDRLESRGLEYMNQVRDGYLTESKRLGDRVLLVDATQSAEAVHEQIIARVTKLAS